MKKESCPTCSGDGSIEVCTGCGHRVDNCECEDPPPTEVEECPECSGTGEIEKV